LAAAVFLTTHFLASKPAIHHLFASVGEMSASTWQKLNMAWVIFFVLAGVLNLYVAYNFSEAFWVKFKVLGFTAITFVFIIVQMLWLFRVIKNDKQREPGTD
jgi:intracellular septation protein